MAGFADVAIRINPSAAAQGGAMRMGGKRPHSVSTRRRSTRSLQGSPPIRHSISRVLHLFAGTQILDADVLLAQWAYGLKLAAIVGEKRGVPVARIDLGGGLGVPYHEGDQTLDLAAVADGARRLDQERRSNPWLASAKILIEPGRYLAGPAGSICPGCGL